jgi:hypothetical protein
MATTTNYGWTTPDDTGLVKDGAAAIRTLGSSVDTTTKNLNPSTTLGDIEYRSSSANTNTRLAIGTTGQVLTVAAGVPSWATPVSGKVLQVVSTIKNDTFTSSSITYADVTGLSVSITPSSATSKIIVIAAVSGNGDVGVNTSAIRLVRDSTAIAVPATAGSRTLATAQLFNNEPSAMASSIVSFYDSPATTSATTYKIQCVVCAGSGTTFINRADSDGDASSVTRAVSTITVMEIGA